MPDNTIVTERIAPQPLGDLDEFKIFMQQREDAARSYVNGEAAPLGRLITELSPATFFAPDGGYEQGADAVWSTYRQGATSFATGGDTSFVALHQGACDGLAYWTGLQQATVRMHGHPEPVPMTLRVTEIFRREGDEWKLIHRHADALATAAKR